MFIFMKSIMFLFVLFVFMCFSQTVWTTRNAGTTAFLQGVTYGNGLFVAVGQMVLYSSDGSTWTIKGDIGGLNGVAYGNGLFVAVGGLGGIFTSSDAKTWTARDSNAIYYSTLYSVVYGNGMFVAAGQLGAIPPSHDGITWTKQSIPSSSLSTLYSVTYGNGLFVAVGQSGTIFVSPDGMTWTKQTSGTTSNLQCVTYGNGKYVAVGWGDSVSSSTGAVVFFRTILTSPEGSTWTVKSTITSSYYLHSVAYGNGYFVICGELGLILVSQDAITWTTINTSTIFSLYSVIYGNGMFVAVGDAGKILTSNAVNIISNQVIQKNLNCNELKVNIDKDHIELLLPKIPSDAIFTIDLFSISGKRLYTSTQHANVGKCYLSTLTLSTGTYLMSIQGSNIASYLRLIVVK